MSGIIEQARAMRTETRDALRTVYESLNQGQQKKLLKDEAVVVLFERYGVLDNKAIMAAQEVSADG